MKNTIFLLTAVLSLSGIGAHADTSGDLIITSFKLADNLATLEWTGGRPNYQVQMLPNFHKDWENLGGPTTNTTATFPSTAGEAYFRVVSDFTALYRVDFNATWSQQTHPVNWTTNAHWSGLVGGVHNSAAHFFRDGELASEGI